MPNALIKQKFELATRSEFTKVECEVSLTLDGKELPSLTVQGTALEAMLQVLKQVVRESYQAVPPRV